MFDAHSDLITARKRLRERVDAALAALSAGRAPERLERTELDFKEEPGRRGQGGVILEGDTRNAAAVEMLAREVPCLANTPGGGALVLGVEDRTWRLIGTALDPEWLRHRIWERVDVAPAIEERTVDGTRLLILFVAEAREPVEDPDRKIRWRVADHCQPVDRSEWWLQRQEAAGFDPMAAATTRHVADVDPGAIVAARRILAAADAELGQQASETSPADLLRRLGVLRPDDTLTQAGALLFCPAPTTLVTFSRIDVPGGEVIGPPADLSGLALIEQFAAVERSLEAVNQTRTVPRGLAHLPVRQLPPSAVREAVLNGLIHRDWVQPDPVAIVWYEHDSTLEVISPGGFVGGVTAGNLLTQRYARYPALSDLFRALRLVDKQGIGVDRMYRDLAVFGHRPPQITEEPGPRVRTRLVGGDPVVPVMTLMEAIQPEYRRRDLRVVVLTYQLLHEPLLTVERTASILQCTRSEAMQALEIAASTSVAGQPLIEPYKDAWLLSTAAARIVEATADTATLHRRGLLTYRRPVRDPAEVVARWLDAHDRITTRDYARLTGMSQPGALKALDRLVRDGELQRGAAAGRNAHYHR